jgi:hypothetical protein
MPTSNAIFKRYIQTLRDKKWDSTPYTNPKRWKAMPKTLMSMKEINQMSKETLSGLNEINTLKKLVIETEIN